MCGLAAAFQRSDPDAVPGELTDCGAAAMTTCSAIAALTAKDAGSTRRATGAAAACHHRHVVGPPISRCMTRQDGPHYLQRRILQFPRRLRRTELIAAGYSLPQPGDSEVIRSMATRAWGPAFSRDHGMLALVIWDHVSRRWSPSRDRFGEPLHYALRRRDRLPRRRSRRSISWYGGCPRRSPISRHLHDFLSFSYMMGDATASRHSSTAARTCHGVRTWQAARMEGYWRLPTPGKHTLLSNVEDFRPS